MTAAATRIVVANRGTVERARSDAQLAATRTHVSTLCALDTLPAPLERYTPLASALDQLRTLARHGMEEVRYGASSEGRPLYAFRIGTGPLRVLYMANIHAMELLGTEVILGLAKAFVQERPVGREIWLIPSANPDGRARAEDNARHGRRRFARQNARGVDLNRNFAEGFDVNYWMHKLLPGMYQPGTNAFSEVETAALRDFVAAHSPQLALSLHSFGGWLFYPWGNRREPTRDAARFENIAQAMCSRMPHDRYRHRQLGQWARWFAAHGLEIDYLYAQHGTLAFLMEISRGGWSFRRPGSLTDPLCWFNPPDPAREVENVLPAALYLASV